jgi:hypothetical protein
VNPAAPTNDAPDTDELHRVGEKMMLECRKLQQRQALTPLAATAATASASSATTTSAGAAGAAAAEAEAAPPPQLLPCTAIGAGSDDGADWCRAVDTCVKVGLYKSNAVTTCRQRVDNV